MTVRRNITGTGQLWDMGQGSCGDMGQDGHLGQLGGLQRGKSCLGRHRAPMLGRWWGGDLGGKGCVCARKHDEVSCQCGAEGRGSIQLEGSLIPKGSQRGRGKGQICAQLTDSVNDRQQSSKDEDKKQLGGAVCRQGHRCMLLTTIGSHADGESVGWGAGRAGRQRGGGEREGRQRGGG